MPGQDFVDKMANNTNELGPTKNDERLKSSIWRTTDKLD